MPVCFNVFNPKSPFWRNLNHKTRLVRYKMQIFEKSCVLSQGWECAIKELWRSILEKVHARWSTIRWTLRAITKLPFNKSCSCPQFSRLLLIPLISSLCSAICPEAHSGLSSLLCALSPLCYYKHNTTQLSPIYHHNPFQHLIIQTQNQQNQTKNNSK